MLFDRLRACLGDDFTELVDESKVTTFYKSNLNKITDEGDDSDCSSSLLAVEFLFPNPPVPMEMAGQLLNITNASCITQDTVHHTEAM